jgi:hypothetical protein
VALRFVQGGFGRAPVLRRATGEMIGMLTAFDLLKAKHWENMQEMEEPGMLGNLSLARFLAQQESGGEPPERENL